MDRHGPLADGALGRETLGTSPAAAGSAAQGTQRQQPEIKIALHARKRRRTHLNILEES